MKTKKLVVTKHSCIKNIKGINKKWKLRIHQ